MDRWGSAGESSFGVHLGVFWHQVEAILESPSFGKLPPPERHCTFRIDLGRTVMMPPKPWWKVDHASDYDAIAVEVLGDLIEFGVPWLDYRSSLKHSLDWKRYATPEGNGRYSSTEIVNTNAKVVFNVMLDNLDDACLILKKCRENGYAEHAQKLAERLGLPAE